MRADDGVPAPKILVHIRHVHRAAFAFRDAGRFAEQLGHHLFGGDAAVDRHAMVAVGGDHPVLRLAQRDQAGADRLLADIQVQEAADLALLVELGSSLLHPADQHHLIIKIQLGGFFHNIPTSNHCDDTLAYFTTGKKSYMPKNYTIAHQ